VSLIRRFWLYFSPKHFLIGDTATTKEVVITGFHLWQSQRFNRHNAYAREVLFWQGFGFRFRFSRPQSNFHSGKKGRFGGFDNQRIKSDSQNPKDKK